LAQGKKPGRHSGKSYIIDLRFADVPQPPKPDYALMDNWAALPDKKDAADKTPRGLQNGQAEAKADVFFIHPTSYTGSSGDSFLWNADVRNARINRNTDRGTIRYQASIFNADFRVFAPRYRQAHYFSFQTFYTEDKRKALELAYSDVKNAFLYYLQHYRSGRPFIIASHSQGTIHAHRLLRELVEGKPLQQDFIGAYLPGMPVPADSFNLLLPCKDSTDYGCWTSWRTWRFGYEPNSFHATCHNPITWTTDTIFIAKKLHRGAVLRDFRKVRRGICDAKVHKGILWIHRPNFPGSRLIKNPNYHIGDYNLFYMDVRTNASLRLQKFLEKQMVQKNAGASPE
jgi:hypothetical protein